MCVGSGITCSSNTLGAIITWRFTEKKAVSPKICYNRERLAETRAFLP